MLLNHHNFVSLENVSTLMFVNNIVAVLLAKDIEI
jgi:hypothetical protein